MADTFAFADLLPRERYKMLCATVVPRPVAWITSINAKGLVNAAPFSFFNVFAEDPALVIIGMNRKPGGARKDTLNNIETASAFAVNMADRALASTMVASAATFPEDMSEPEALGLELAPGRTIPVPHIAAAPVALECTLFELRALGPERHLIMGEVKALIARDGLFDATTKRLNVGHYDPVARLHGVSYGRLGETYDLPIPTWQDATTTLEDAP
ncbi:MAG: flavin reductase family protein [Pseudomonadota bacterium]